MQQDLAGVGNIQAQIPDAPRPAWRDAYGMKAWIVAVLLWVALSIYALVEMIGDGRPSAVAVLLIVVLLVGTLVTLAAVGFGFVGKRLTPGKRDRG